MKSKSIPKLMFCIAGLIILAQHLIIGSWTFTTTLMLLVPIPYVQNMAFTWVSRSRQGGDPDHHRKAAWASNGVWAIAQAFVAANIYAPITFMVDKNQIIGEQVSRIILTIIIYAIATAEGSVFMMKINLGRITKLPKIFGFLVETGKRKVGER